MEKDSRSRLETACNCLDLAKPSKDEWLKKSDAECERVSGIMRALSDPIRVRIVEMLFKDSLYVCLIQYLLDDINYSRLSYHLDVLKKVGILISAREGNFLRYSLTDEGRRIAMDLLSL